MGYPRLAYISSSRLSLEITPHRRCIENSELIEAFKKLGLQVLSSKLIVKHFYSMSQNLHCL